MQSILGIGLCVSFSFFLLNFFGFHVHTFVGSEIEFSLIFCLCLIVHCRAPVDTPVRSSTFAVLLFRCQTGCSGSDFDTPVCSNPLCGGFHEASASQKWLESIPGRFASMSNLYFNLKLKFWSLIRCKKILSYVL